MAGQGRGSDKRYETSLWAGVMRKAPVNAKKSKKSKLTVGHTVKRTDGWMKWVIETRAHDYKKQI